MPQPLSFLQLMPFPFAPGTTNWRPALGQWRWWFLGLRQPCASGVPLQHSPNGTVTGQDRAEQGWAQPQWGHVWWGISSKWWSLRLRPTSSYVFSTCQVPAAVGRKINFIDPTLKEIHLINKFIERNPKRRFLARRVSWGWEYVLKIKHYASRGHFYFSWCACCVFWGLLRAQDHECDSKPRTATPSAQGLRHQPFPVPKENWPRMILLCPHKTVQESKGEWPQGCPQWEGRRWTRCPRKQCQNYFRTFLSRLPWFCKRQWFHCQRESGEW